MLSGAFTEWLPTFGESWHVVHVPAIDATCNSSFSPLTPVMSMGCVLKRAWPRATAARAAAYGACDDAVDGAHASNSVNARGSNAAPDGFWPSGSLMPMKND